MFEPDDWEEDIGEDDVLSTSLHDPDVDDDGTLSSERVTIDGTSTSATLSLQQELLQTAVDDYYNAAAEAGLTPSLGRDPGKFELVDGQIRLKAYPNLDLVNKRSGRPLALSTLASRGGTKAIREDLGFADWAAKKSSLPAQAVEALQTTNLELGEAAAAVDSVELEDLGQTVTEVSDAIQRMETALTATQIDEVLGTLDDPPAHPPGNTRAWQGPANHPRRAYQQPRQAHRAWWPHCLGETQTRRGRRWRRRRVNQTPHRLAPAWPTRWEIGPARGCVSLKGRPSFSNLPHTGNNRQGIEWRHHIGRAGQDPLSWTRSDPCEHPHGGRHGYQYARPCVNRKRRHCNPTIPTTSPIGQRRSSRVGQKDSPSSWPCLGQTGWQGGCGPTGDHWEHRLLAPRHLGEGRRMARRARVGSGGSRWRPALPGCDRNCQELLASHKWH